MGNKFGIWQSVKHSSFAGAIAFWFLAAFLVTATPLTAQAAASSRSVWDFLHIPPKRCISTVLTCFIP